MKDTIFINSTGEIWRGGEHIIVYLRDLKTSRKIASWKGSVLSALYFNQNAYGKQYRVPKNLLDRTIQVMREAENFQPVVTVV